MISRPVADDSESGLASLWILAALIVVIPFFMVAFNLWSSFLFRQQLAELAEASARSGANGIDTDYLNEVGELRMDEDEAREYAFETFELQPLVQNPQRGEIVDRQISFEGNQVTFTVTGSLNMFLLGSRSIELDATAEPRISNENTGPDVDASLLDGITSSSVE